MSFALFLLYVFMSFFRPIELYAPELGEYRPMMLIWGIAFVSALTRSVLRRELAARRLHLGLLLGLTTMVALSQVFIGWTGGAMASLSTFSPSLMLFVLVILNVTTLGRLKASVIVLALAMVGAGAVSIQAYRTGVNAPLLVVSQITPALEQAEADGQDLSEVVKSEIVPAKDTSGWYLWRIRGAGFLNDPNDFAQAMVMLLPLLLAFWRRGAWLRNTLMVLAPGALLGYAMYLTQSRGAIVGVGAMVMAGFAHRYGRTRTLLIGGVLVAIAAAGSLATGGRGFSSKERSAEERIESWHVGLQLLREHPLSGAGFGNFTDHHYLTAHNSYVLAFAELGLVGYFFWLSLIVLNFKDLGRGVKDLPATSDEHRWALHMRTALVGFLACAWFLSRTYSPTLFFLLGLATSASWIANHAIARASLPAAAPTRAVTFGPAPDPGAGLLTETPPWRRDTFVMVITTVLAVYGFIVVHRL
ncbi:O-antigen ligase family protein [Leptothrix discophora]|uniref:O-antigen ligase family protein n=1 Tax=Leptothrix discophora TaxID=89 RepID=A0ABT9G094_LEPDI|nr:O-antigen ligase family protein [Leptothrix discophora]MDP4299904.1 O-antigen ligase family protein [Leptothrix discophora]